MSNENVNVDDFMRQLKEQTAAPMSKGFTKSKTLEKISLNFEGNFGRYQILPVNSTILNYPFIKLNNTREICIPRKNVAQDGTESVYNAWYKILPKEAYKFKDLNGRVTSSLTAEEDQLLTQAYAVFDQLYNELDAKNNMKVCGGLLRKRNYTIFNGYCINKWESGKPSTPSRSNFSGLFIATAKGFMNAVEDSINEKTAITSGDLSWINNIYGRQSTGRNGFMMFSISRDKNVSMSYSVKVTHEANVPGIAQAVIPEEDLELMQNPVLNFLGWQVNREDESVPVENRRLFNSKLIEEAINFMAQLLGNIRNSKNTGTSVEDAIKITIDTATKNQEVNNNFATNDPMLKVGQTVAPMGISAEEMAARNSEPFQTPPAARIDPITSAPVNNNQNATTTPFSSPFGGFAANPTPSANIGGMEGELPF